MGKESFMLSPNRASNKPRAWLVVGALFITMFFTYAVAMAFGVFFIPLTQHFAWSHAQTASLITYLYIAMALTNPLAGTLLDRLPAQVLIAAGAFITGTGSLIASQGNWFWTFVAAFILLGIGLSFSTLIPSSFVIANWFKEKRGLPLGLVVAGMNTGGSALSLVSAYMIGRLGWRWAFVGLALPPFLVVIPVVVSVVRSNPSGSDAHAEMAAAATDMAAAEPPTSGLDVAQALAGRSFWLIVICYSGYLFVGAGAIIHLVPCLTGLGYKPQTAAMVMSACLITSVPGKVLFGFLADHFGAGKLLCLNLLSMAAGCFIITHWSSPLAIAAFVIIYNNGSGSPLVLVPMLAAESFGLKRYGTLLGIVNAIGTLGSIAGPLVGGAIFDVTTNYMAVYKVFMVVVLIAAFAPLTCRRFEPILSPTSA